MSDTYTLWVCVDCMLHHANGECGSCHMDSEGTWDGHDREPWSAVGGNDTFTMGLLDSEHVEDCQRRMFADALFAATALPDSGYECNCETRDFSWRQCDACGSTLGGERHAFTGWVGDRHY